MELISSRPLVEMTGVEPVSQKPIHKKHSYTIVSFMYSLRSVQGETNEPKR